MEIDIGRNACQARTRGVMPDGPTVTKMCLGLSLPQKFSTLSLYCTPHTSHRNVYSSRTTSVKSRPMHQNKGKYSRSVSPDHRLPQRLSQSGTIPIGAYAIMLQHNIKQQHRSSSDSLLPPASTSKKYPPTNSMATT